MDYLCTKVEADIERENIIIRYSEACEACSAIIRKVKGILISLGEKDAEDPTVSIKSSDWAWKLAHEITHLNYYRETMYRPDEGTQIIQDKENLTDNLAIRQYLDEDEILDFYIDNCGNAKETAEDLQIPLEVLQKAFRLYEETSEHFRERCAEINAHYLWASD